MYNVYSTEVLCHRAFGEPSLMSGPQDYSIVLYLLTPLLHQQHRALEHDSALITCGDNLSITVLYIIIPEEIIACF